MLTETQQAPVDLNIVEKVASFLRSPPDYIQQLNSLEHLHIFLLISCGLVFMLYGWRLFKALVIVDAAAIGVLIGANLLGAKGMGAFGAIAGGLLFAILAWPLMKYAVSLLGGLAGCFLGYGLWHYIANMAGSPQMNEHAWAGALIGLITLGLLAFVIFRVTIIIVTALQGAIMAVSGSIALAMQTESMKDGVHSHLSDPNLVPLLILIPALIGVVLQYSLTCKKPKSKSKPKSLSE